MRGHWLREAPDRSYSLATCVGDASTLSHRSDRPVLSNRSFPIFGGRAITNSDSGQWGLDASGQEPTRSLKVDKRAPYLDLWLIARGINFGLNTRKHCDDDARDPALRLVEWENRRAETAEITGSLPGKIDNAAVLIGIGEQIEAAMKWSGLIRSVARHCHCGLDIGETVAVATKNDMRATTPATLA